jgi:hypothetical protein
MEQQNDHCMLFAGGQYWWITKMSGLGRITCRRWELESEFTTVLDLSAVRWNDYIDKAVSLVRENARVFQNG